MRSGQRQYSTQAAQTVKVPPMGDSISEGVVAEWKKKAGDAVAMDEVVVTLDTDKITVEVRSPVAGVFEEALHPADATVPVGAELFKIKAGAAASAGAAGAAAPKAAASKPAEAAKPAKHEAAAKSETAATPAAKPSGKIVSVAVPKLTESVDRGAVKEILVKPGQGVKADQVVLIIDTDKIAVDVRTPVAGVVDSVLVKVEQEVLVGHELIKVIEGAAATESAEAPKAAAAPQSAKPAASEASPSKPAAAAGAKAESKPAAPSRPIITSSGAIERIDSRVKMTQARKRIAQRLKDSQNTAAILTTFNECDMSALMSLREQYKDRFLERYGVKLGFMSAFLKASAIALQENPVVNGTMDGDEIIYRNYIDISVAVATPTSLVTPVVRNVERMNLADIERTIGELGEKAKTGKLGLDDLAGGTFSVSNGGVFGSLMGTPIINPPQSAILGMHAINKRPVAIGDKVEIRPMMYLALSYDHRIIDGREAVTTLKRIKALVEDPVSMLLDL
jgi:2-oxoglutarate dehydrogenase E2 component (dihydrolipoamide succinyltransferase)